MSELEKKEHNVLDEMDFTELESISGTKDKLQDSEVDTNLQKDEFDDLADILNKEDVKKSTVIDEEKLRKEVKRDVKKSLKEQFKLLTPKMKAILSNFYLLVFLLGSLYLFYTSIIPNIKELEAYKKDISLIKKDVNIVKSNLDLLDENIEFAFEYRRVNDLLIQSVPVGLKYEDNIPVIMTLLKDSINEYSKNKKLINSLNISPSVSMRELQQFQIKNVNVVGVQYDLNISGFESFYNIKQFLISIEDRLKIFHIPSIKITKNVSDIGENTYTMTMTLISYYRVNIDDGVSQIENTFK